MVFYNEIDSYCAAWLRNLIAAGQIVSGEVDERDIRLVRPDEVRSYRRAHFFAGIAGWDYALRLAGWPNDRPVWTGSCPCQPFSAAGKRKGVRDSRDLWPAFRDLIAECRPATIFGEQVASADGRLWLARVRTDLEALGYAVGAADLCAAGVGAPHIRQRLYWVADSDHARLPQRECDGRVQRKTLVASQGQAFGSASPWATGTYIQCLDGKARRVEPGIQPLAHGVSARVGKLRAYGNAIVAPLAAEFVKAFLETEVTERRKMFS